MLSCHKDGNSTVANGEFKGLTLKETIDRCGTDILGSDAAAFENFPVLIKLIDAKQNLSVQVHPGDEYALKHEHEYGTVLRAKGIVAGENGWLHFDYVPGEPDLRKGCASVTGRLCVIGCKINEEKLKTLFKA